MPSVEAIHCAQTEAISIESQMLLILVALLHVPALVHTIISIFISILVAPFPPAFLSLSPLPELRRSQHSSRVSRLW